MTSPEATQLLQDALAVADEFATGAWIDPSLPGAGTSLSQLAGGEDPLAPVLNSGIPWLIEQVRPLVEAQQAVTGDPSRVEAYALSWRSAATAGGRGVDTLDASVARAQREWRGNGGDSYRAVLADHQAALRGLSTGAATHADMVVGAGQVVARTRMAVRAQLAEFVSELNQKLPQWASEQGVPVSLFWAPIVAAVAALVARFGGLIYRLILLLIACLRALAPLVRRLNDLLGRIGRFLRRLGRREEEPKPIEEQPKPVEESPKPHEEDNPNKPTRDDEYDRRWEEAEEDLRRQNRQIEEDARYDNPTDAIGQRDGQVRITDKEPMGNPGLAEEGFTEAWYVVDRNGTQWTVPYNPVTRQFMRGHHSKSN